METSVNLALMKVLAKLQPRYIFHCFSALTACMLEYLTPYHMRLVDIQ